jgi:hypothetical protein
MPDDVHLLAASEDRSWSLWDAVHEKMVAVRHVPLGPVRGVAMAPDQVGGGGGGGGWRARRE